MQRAATESERLRAQQPSPFAISEAASPPPTIDWLVSASPTSIFNCINTEKAIKVRQTTMDLYGGLLCANADWL